MLASTETIVNLLIISLSLACLGTLIFKGLLTERTLKLGPIRNPGFSQAIFARGALLSVAYVVLVVISRESNSMAFAMLVSLLPFAVIGLAIGRCTNVLGGLRVVGLLPRQPMRDLKWCAIAIPITLLFSWSVGLIAMKLSMRYGLRISPGGHDTLVDLLKHFSAAKLLLVFVSAVVMAPLIEELVFRGVMQTSLLHVFGMSRWAAMLYTATLFSLTHAWVVPWQNLITLFVLGLVFGYLYERTGSLLVPILTHAGFNAANIVIALSLP